MTDVNDFLWVEKHRPHTIADTILPSDLKKTFQQFVDQENVPNLLLSGKQGIGKTTVAKAMLDQIGADYMVINGSMEGNIDTLRVKIANFASTVSFAGGRKYVILDEADYLNCLSEDEYIIMSDGTKKQLKDLEYDKQYSVVSFNMETGEFEEDTAELIKTSTQLVYEIQLEDGKTIEVTDDHPIICEDDRGNIVQRTIKQGLDGYKIIVK